MVLHSTDWHPEYLLSGALWLCLLCMASRSCVLHVTSAKRTTCSSLQPPQKFKKLINLGKEYKKQPR